MSGIDSVAKSFVDYYYSTFDTNRAALISLYKEESMLTFEGQQFKGTASINEKLTSLPFQKVVHNVNTLDAQPGSPSSSSLIVTATGHLTVDDSPNPLMFCQTFHLVSEGNSFWVYNDIFRLNCA
ncbi:hypothetical protein G6F46_007265 [Rhizopus delemar]|uniref:Nuclear transport factor 2 n=3 Tax=Rhizopus TaxID=4842 RepID=I1CIT3_RHIO9|nr:hypothetical protein RO3G_13074 [Rhizopus delemar RA 99-880]KAG1058106.1 hypothetical protein G6F43_000098 [Rhizopus delemar]KAG1169210.1 hypothetical protein G6F36_012108 [Rhizopus arrhizus]KAG1457436.1 hypothetical protein G6F55_005933 [Rhizopus delemar]KAG1496272.1 hypothetical protein G6F54_006587 [Rhizopus delemar]|eukprot:EIE88363.1 hypothetical protein RO3G_13074 [Rhizopus delemar RA 99-880]